MRQLVAAHAVYSAGLDPMSCACCVHSLKLTQLCIGCSSHVVMYTNLRCGPGASAYMGQRGTSKGSQ